MSTVILKKYELVKDDEVPTTHKERDKDLIEIINSVTKTIDDYLIRTKQVPDEKIHKNISN